jgi:hypothetical protein
MKKKIIVKISEGLGNQLFMYANAFSLKKKHELNLYIDSLSGYYNDKAIYSYVLNNFNLSSDLASDKYIFASPLKNIKKKIYLFFDKFFKNKKFLFENRETDKSTFYSPVNIDNTKNFFFLDGNFESEKYFIDYKSDILNEFSFKNKHQFDDNKYLKLIKTRNVVSICIRQNRFSERINNKKSKIAIEKSRVFLKETINYINNAIIFFKNKIDNPIFLIWSNDFDNLEEFFSGDEFIFVINQKNKVITDFFLLTQCRYFIVAPSTFHWWGAWLSDFDNKICVRPKNLNPSNNRDFWPEKWIPI